jgi:hypothetical protein
MKVALAVVVVALVAAVSASASSAPGFLGCKSFTAPHSKLQVKPASIIVACGDGGFYFSKLRWTSWSGKLVHANGLGNANDCSPNCAAGHFHTYVANVSLGTPKTCGGRTEFTKLSWTFPGKRPKGQPKSGSQIFRCA